MNDLLVKEESVLFLSDKDDDMGAELYMNSKRIELSMQLAKEISEDELLDFLKRVKVDRQSQLSRFEEGVQLLYYSWLDHEAATFRFSFVNAVYDENPFDCEVVFVKNEKEMVERFLRSDYHDGIPIHKLELNGDMSGVVLEEKPLRIYLYREIISCLKQKK